MLPRPAEITEYILCFLRGRCAECEREKLQPKESAGDGGQRHSRAKKIKNVVKKLWSAQEIEQNLVESWQEHTYDFDV